MLLLLLIVISMVTILDHQGVIGEGSDADIVVWDGEATRVISAKTHHQVNQDITIATVSTVF